MELAQALDIYQSLSPKRFEEITKIIDEYESHRKVFEAHVLPNSKLTIARCNTLLCVMCDAVLSFTLSTQYIVYTILCMLAHKIITQ